MKLEDVTVGPDESGDFYIASYEHYSSVGLSPEEALENLFDMEHYEDTYI